ncbi:MAG: MBL fold metallo-hydrolase [Chloroflexota bacterium]
MVKMVILGSSYAVADESHENTHMVLIGSKRSVMVDCVCRPIFRLKKAGIDFNGLTGLILTHFHPDHVSGVPLLLMNMWILKRTQPLIIYGLHHTLDRVEHLMRFYGWEDWPNFFPVVFHRLPAEEMVPVLENSEYRIHASPVKHLIPTIGLRIEAIRSQKVLVYSCDTEPCPQVVRLAQGADWLIHEAHGEMAGHSSAYQAGNIAREAGVAYLYLIHYPTGDFDFHSLIKEAQKSFNENVGLAEDYMEIVLDETSL